eukprot:gene12142-biopygen21455
MRCNARFLAVELPGGSKTFWAELRITGHGIGSQGLPGRSWLGTRPAATPYAASCRPTTPPQWCAKLGIACTDPRSGWWPSIPSSHLAPAAPTCGREGADAPSLRTSWHAAVTRLPWALL